ncbi:conserved hypothetical protein [Peptoniphilus harei ACS-146-V-Sch2b]|uniref:Uncharacterized protein n=1 Tax=Peptoniphilus harei ACS-146-V-Sch2b TaxID=908338 RepID=E4L0P0_9FIRM|nr:hypothetical protein [Peptoniphilus harei]EFR32342.1 conserved hypothetical protein [Peptoniphilus harei ACS-146-V-Sch2b]
MRIKINPYNLGLTFRRALGLMIIFLSIYIIGSFFIKFIFFVLYAGTLAVDGLFKILVSLF